MACRSIISCSICCVHTRIIQQHTSITSPGLNPSMHRVMDCVILYFNNISYATLNLRLYFSNESTYLPIPPHRSIPLSLIPAFFSNSLLPQSFRLQPINHQPHGHDSRNLSRHTIVFNVGEEEGVRKGSLVEAYSMREIWDRIELNECVRGCVC